MDTKTTVVNVRTAKCDVYIGRRCGKWPSSKWGNPFKMASEAERDEVIRRYAAWLVQQPELMASLDELRGKRLGCWCAPKPCHGDVLATLANQKAL